MLRIRLTRLGRRNRPFYRIVVVESSKKRDTGKYVAKLGTYDPLAPKGKKLNLDKKAFEEWKQKGAKVSDAVLKLVLTVKEKKLIWPDRPKKTKETESKEEGAEPKQEIQEDKSSKEETKIEDKTQEQKVEEPKSEDKSQKQEVEEAKEEPKKEE